MNAILRLINCKLLLYRDILNSPIFNLLPIAGIQRFRIQEYLETNMRPVDNDLVLRRLFPVDYGQSLTESVICPYSGCPFSTGEERR